MSKTNHLEQLVNEADTMRSAMRTAQRADLMRATRERAGELLDAINTAVADGEFDEAAAILAGFFRPLVESEHAAEVDSLLSTLVACAPQIKDPERRFQIHEVAYIEAFLKGEDAADDHCTQLFVIAEASGSNDLLARALTARCRLGLRDEDAASVEADARALADVAAELGDNIHAGFAPHMVANLREMQHRPADAIELFTESSQLFADAGAEHLVLTEVFNLAACHLDVGQTTEARNRFDQTYRLMQQLGNNHIEPELLSSLAALVTEEGDSDVAALLIGASEAAQQRHSRVLYPMEAKAAKHTRLRLEENLGDEGFEEQRSAGLELTFREAVRLAGLGSATTD